MFTIDVVKNRRRSQLRHTEWLGVLRLMDRRTVDKARLVCRGFAGVMEGNDSLIPLTHIEEFSLFGHEEVRFSAIDLKRVRVSSDQGLE